MNSMYEVSIIMPVYNVASYVAASLTSALMQNFASIEYVIVNDCATDNSMAIINSVVNSSMRQKDVLIVNREVNGGLSAARNTGLENSHGRYIFIMDSDDEISSDCISLLYAKAEDSKADFIVSNIRLIGSRSLHIKPVHANVSNEKPLISYFNRSWSVSACNKLYRRDFIDKYNLRFVEGIHHEDYLWSYEVAKNAKRLAVVEEQTYDYKIRQGSITTITNSDLKIQSMLYVLKTIGKDTSGLDSYRNKFLGFVGFNTALYILNYKGERKQREYYDELKLIIPSRSSLFNGLIKLPYPLFYIVIKPIYIIYKYLITK